MNVRPSAQQALPSPTLITTFHTNASTTTGIGHQAAAAAVRVDADSSITGNVPAVALGMTPLPTSAHVTDGDGVCDGVLDAVLVIDAVDEALAPFERVAVDVYDADNDGVGVCVADDVAHVS